MVLLLALPGLQEPQVAVRPVILADLSRPTFGYWHHQASPIVAAAGCRSSGDPSVVPYYHHPSGNLAGLAADKVQGLAVHPCRPSEEASDHSGEGRGCEAVF